MTDTWRRAGRRTQLMLVLAGLGALLVGLAGLFGLAGRFGAAGVLGPPRPAPAATGSAAGTSPAPTSGLVAALAQFREDEVLGQLRVRLTQTDPARPDVRVATVALRWAGLQDGPPVRVDYPLQPGVPVDLAVPIPAARCGDPPRADAPLPPTGSQQVTALVTLAGPADASGGSTGRTLAVPVTNASETLRRAFPRACRAQALAALVTVGFGRTWTPARVTGLPVLRGVLVVDRVAAGVPLRVTGLDGSVLLRVLPAPGADPLPVRLPPDGRLVLPVDITATGRCDGHALGESKQTYVFDVTITPTGPAGSAAPTSPVAPGGLRGPQPVTVAAPDRLRPALWDTLLRACTALSGG